MRPRPIFALTLIMVLLLSACNLPVAPTTTPTNSPELSTAAAVTIQAMQTRNAIFTIQPQTPETTQTQPATGTAVAQATVTSGPPATATNTRVPPTNTSVPCDAANFIQDVTVPDGTKMAAGQSFTKTWRLRNAGTCTWNKSYALTFVSGDAMGAPAIVNLPGDVPPNATVDVSIDMRAPNTPGRFTGNWKLRNAAGIVFGVEGGMSFFVVIEVVAATLTPTITATTGPSFTPTVGTPTLTTSPTVTVTPTSGSAPGVLFDFTANACQAEWRSAAGVLPCPGNQGDVNGAAVKLTNPVLETGDSSNQPVLLTQPQSAVDGAITGTFPAITIHSGDHFRATLGCLGGQNQCSVKYQLNYRESGGAVTNIRQWTQTYDGAIQGIDEDLSFLDGKSVQIILVVVSDGPSNQDAALWIFPRISKG